MAVSMRPGWILLFVGAAATISCGGEGGPASPSSMAAPGAILSNGPLADEPPPPSPGNPAPAPVPPPAPASRTITIVDTSGPAAFLPNPVAAVVGDLIVWANTDSRPHHIVLDDGSDVGTLAPGQSSTAIAMRGSAMGYRCTIHPSMVGMIHDPAVPPPAPAPPYEPPPPDPYPDPYY